MMRLSLAAEIGYKIIWTVHNLLPHRQPLPPIHRMVRRFVIRRVDGMIVHCNEARQQLTVQFPSHKPIRVIPHGNYSEAYPMSVSREHARRTLGIEPDSFVYLHLGNIASYKGIESFASVFCEQADPQDIALIAGRCNEDELSRRLHELSLAEPRVRLHVGFIADDEIQLFLRAADVLVACFREILTSGSVILGMTAGLPIIAPALGCLPELVTKDAGLLYDPKAQAGLRDALLSIKRLDAASMGRRAAEIADTLTWSGIAEKTAEFYLSCLQ
jgi:glycosyltransferase involved in cell wall biosynthesis